ncbi:MAG: BON domain-containing protein [Pseudomonadota bacterium]
MKRINPTAIAAAIVLAFGTPALAAETTPQSGAKAASGTAASVGEYVDDAVVTSKIKTAIFQDSTLKATEINVETHQGIVQLSGFVKSRADINQAVRLTRGVKGVKSIKNDMVVKGKQ